MPAAFLPVAPIVPDEGRFVHLSIHRRDCRGDHDARRYRYQMVFIMALANT
jgi:hypothetical protein